MGDRKSRNETNVPVNEVSCVVLVAGYTYIIDDRSSTVSLFSRAMKVYGTGKRITMSVTVRGVPRSMTVMFSAPFAERSGYSLGFTGIIANGGELVEIEGELTGETGGMFRLVTD